MSRVFLLSASKLVFSDVWRKIVKLAVTSKANVVFRVVDAASVRLDQASIVKLDIPADQIASFSRVGNNLVIELKDGQVVRIENFYNKVEGQPGNEVQTADGKVWTADATLGDEAQTALGNDDQLAGDGLLPVLGGLAALGGIAALAIGSKDKDENADNGGQGGQGGQTGKTVTPAEEAANSAAEAAKAADDAGRTLTKRK